MTGVSICTYEVSLRFTVTSKYVLKFIILLTNLFGHRIRLVQKFNNHIEQRQNQKQYSKDRRLRRKPFTKVIVSVYITTKNE